jgi:hypothetical protein
MRSLAQWKSNDVDICVWSNVQMNKILSRDVQVREFQREDLADMLNYFFESSAEFLNSIGLRTPQPGAAEKSKVAWEKRLDERAKGAPAIPVLTVLYQGERVGFHTSTHREPGRSLIMHAHFFRKDLRGKGIGTVSYVLAIEKFLTDYGFEEVIFKTPKRNAAPMRIKEKLGLTPVNEEVIDWPELVEPLPVQVFRVTRTELPALKGRVGLK